MRFACLGVCCLAVLAACSSYAFTVDTGTNYQYVTCDADETLVLDGTLNTAKTIVYLSTGNTLSLTGEADADGVSTLRAHVYGRSEETGSFVLDASDVSGCTSVRWLGHLRTFGTVTVKGTSKVVFGSSRALTATSTNDNLLFCPGDFVIETEGGEGLVFTNGVAYARTPTCPWTASPGLRLAVIGDARLGATTDETLPVDAYDLTIANGASILPPSITVSDGREVAYRQCFIQPDTTNADKEFWRWGGLEATLGKNIVLNGENAVFSFASSQLATIGGSVSGNGYIQPLHQSATYIALGGDLSQFTGCVRLSNKTTGLYVNGPYLHDVRYEADKVGGAVVIDRANAATGNALGRVDFVSGGNDANHRFDLSSGQVLTIGELTGGVLFDGDATALVVIEHAADNAKIRLRGGVHVKILACEPTVTVTLGAGSEGEAKNWWGVAGPDEGEPVSFNLVQQYSGGAVEFSGQLKLGGLEGQFQRVTLLDGTLRANLGSAADLVFRGGELISSLPTWQEKVALWLDASDAASIDYVKDLSWAPNITTGTQVGGRELVHTWRDCRSDHQAYAMRNCRFTSAADYDKSLSYKNVYPAHAVGELNGRDYLYFSHGNARMAVFAGPTSTKTNVVATKWAVIVYGSQNNSPGNILATVGGVMGRSPARAKALFTNEVYTATQTDVFVNGTAVGAAQENVLGFGWQILSFETKDADVTGLNQLLVNSNNGSGLAVGNGNFAEVLLFSALPTEAERKQVEKYLSDKWGLAIAHDGAFREQKLGGFGSLRLVEPLSVSGSFSGTVDLNGHELSIREGRYPETEETISRANRTLWVDPSLEGAVRLSDDPERPLEIISVRPRDNAGLSTVSSAYGLYSPCRKDGTLNRRAHLAVGSRGGEKNWIDLANLYPEAPYAANNLMMCQQDVGEPPEEVSTSQNWKSVWYKTIFVVTDTSRGGGTPFAHYAGAGSGDIIKRGASPTASDPIWNAKCKDNILNGANWLNGVRKSSKDGFGSCPEVFTFQPAAEGGSTSSGTQIKAFGCYDIGASINQECFGEILAYNRVLDDEERESIEAYLMAKWIGRLPDGYMDFRQMTVAGDGRLVLPSQQAMPKLAAGFTGLVDFGSLEALAFDVDPAATDASNKISVGAGRLRLPERTAVTVSFAARPVSGQRYALLTGTLEGATTFVLDAKSDLKGRTDGTLVYDTEAKTLYLEFPNRGFLLLFR